MREIEFRGKRIDNGKWVYGDLIQQDRNNPQIEDWSIKPYGDIFSIHPETVGQYTGLKDKNGVKVFEGDIVKAMGNGNERFIIQWPAGKMGFIFNPITHFPDFEFIKRNELLVIGNIHDNPELLEEEEK